MKNLPLAINIILLCAVAFLFYKVFNKNPSVQVLSASTNKEANIVFVNSDTLLDNYPLLKNLEKEFKHRQDSAENVLLARDKSIKQEYAKFEQTAATMPEEEQKRLYNGFMQKQQELEKFRDDLLKSLSAEQEKMQDSVHSNLVQYLKVYNRSHGYDYIMSYQRGNGILLANDSLEITQDVLKGLKEK